MLSGILDWAVVSIPMIVGLLAWFIPISKPTKRHRQILFAACVLFSGLIWLQQHEARNEHAREMANLPTKQDIASLPTAADIVKEFIKVSPGAVTQTSWGLTDNELLELAQSLTPFAASSPKKGDLITAVLGNQDSAKFAQRLVGAFRAAHWDGVGGSGYGQAIFGGPVEGIVIQLHSADDRVPGLNELVSALRKAKIEPTGHILPDAVPEGEFRIVVGSRPSP